MKTQEAPLNTWWCWKRTTTDFIRQHQAAWLLWILAQVTMASRWLKRYVRKSSSMILNEALCGRQPGLFINLYKLWQVYIVFFIWKFQVTLYHCSNKCHNHILYALNIYWVSTLVLDFWKTCRPLIFVCFLVFRVFLFVFFREKYEAGSLLILNLWLVNLG
jgi:hypothetical protein